LTTIVNGLMQDLPVHALGTGISAAAGVVLEIALTFILLYTIYATFVDKSSKSSLTSAPLTVGLTVTAIILAAGPFSSASMNPARSFGPALVAADFTDHWVYWVGPLIGAAAGAIVYDLLFISSTHAILPSNDY
jgi:aquaporin TIP